MKNPDDENRGLKKVSVFMERLWLAIAIVSLVVVCYFFITEGVNARTIQYLVFPGIAGIMYAFRATFRKRFENRNSQD
jgi:hypothetical protein